MKRLRQQLEQQQLMGGGGGAEQIESAPTPTPAPPVTADDSEVLSAQHDYEQQLMAKKSIAKTIFAGDTGDWKPGQAGSPGQGASGTPTSYKGKLG